MELVSAKDLVLRCSKQVDKEGEKLTYRLMQDEMTAVMEFDTYFFDDQIKVELFHRKSTAKANLVGKASVKIRELV